MITNVIYTLYSAYTDDSSTFVELPNRNIYAKIKIKMVKKYHTVAMTRFPGDTATPKHDSNVSLEGCKEKMHI
jgi:hypothetical protein